MNTNETPVEYFYRITKDGNFQHPFVDELYINYNSDLDIRYKVSCTYIFYNAETSEFYIGSGDLNTREKRHLRALENGRLTLIGSNNKINKHHNWKFQRAYNKNQNFNFYYVEMNSRKEALAFEQILIDKYWNNDLFLNIAKYVGIVMLDRKHTEKSIIKMTESQNLVWKNVERRKRQSEIITTYFKNNPEARIRASDIMITKYANGDRISRLGSTTSDETKLLQSKSKKELYDSGYVNPFTGKQHTEESLIKQSRAHRKTWELKTSEERMIWIAKRAASNSKKVVVDSIIYKSQTEVASVFNIAGKTVRQRIASPYFTTWYSYFDMYERPCIIRGTTHISVDHYSKVFQCNQENALSFIHSKKEKHNAYQWC